MMKPEDVKVGQTVRCNFEETVEDIADALEKEEQSGSRLGISRTNPCPGHVNQFEPWDEERYYCPDRAECQIEEKS